MADETTNADIKAMSFEQALEALEKIVDDLERGDVPLDQSIRIYERGEALKAHCDRLLKAAEDKVEKIRLSREASRSASNRLMRSRDPSPQWRSGFVMIWHRGHRLRFAVAATERDKSG